MKRARVQNFQLLLFINSGRAEICWCGLKLATCAICKGTGVYKVHVCYPCDGHGHSCPVHGTEYELISMRGSG